APDREGEGHDVLLWADATAGAAPLVLSARDGGRIPDTLRVRESGGIGFTDDGATVFLGLAAWPATSQPDAAPDDTTDAAPYDATGDVGGDANGAEHEVGPADVQVWHWDDDRILR